MGGERGNLTLEFIRLADRLRPRWLVWENVPGVLSSNGGRDFGAFLGKLGECGYGWAYRCLDAQYAGLAQRRFRVFVVGYIGDWRPAASVLFERESLRWNPAPRRKARKDVAPTISSRTTGGGGLGTDFDLDGGLDQATIQVANTLSTARGTACANAADLETYVPVAYGGNNTSGPIEVATACNAHAGPHGRLDFESETFITHTLTGEGFDASEDGTGRGTPLGPTAFPSRLSGTQCASAVDIAPSMGATNPTAVAFAQNTRDELREMDISGALSAQPEMKQTSYARVAQTVRRLTPRECERLMGFPDDYTAIPYHGKIAADGPRYKALGNSWAVPVVRKIGERIQMVEGILNGR